MYKIAYILNSLYVGISLFTFKQEKEIEALKW